VAFAARHVLECVLILAMVAWLLIWELVHIDAHILLPVLAGGSAVLPLVVEAKASSLSLIRTRRSARSLST